MTLTSATHLYNHSLTFGYNQWDGEILELHFQGCKFNIHDGILGFVHPTIGWFAVVDFEHDCKQDAIESIQWVLDEYGMNYTFIVLDEDAYNEEVSAMDQSNWWQSVGFSPLEEIFGLLIGCSTHREETLELRRKRIIKVISVEPRS